MHRRTTGQRRTTPYPATVSGQGEKPENPPYPRTESPQDPRTGNTSRRGHRKNDKGQRTGGPYGIYHLLPTCHQGVYPSGTQRHPRLLPDR